MKNTLIALLTVVLCISLCACGTRGKAQAPAFHEITVESEAELPQGLGGAAAYDHCLDDPASRYYVINDYYNMESSGSLHILSRFDTYQQTTDFTCGCAAARMVLHYFGEDDYSERALCEMMDVSETEGTSVEAMIDLFTKLGWQVESYAATQPLFTDEDAFHDYVVEKLDAGMPLLIDWLDWAGHWQVIIGVDTCSPESSDDDVLILADPYDVTDHYQDGYYTYPLSRLFYLWREGPCANKALPYEQPFVAVKPN